MINDEVKIRIIQRKDLKVGDTVLFNRHQVIVKSISRDGIWTFGNEDIGVLTMPLYDSYYKIINE